MVFKYKDRDVAVIAHRGGGMLFPENTISAFKGGQKLGVDAVECDVQLTMDGKLAVMHDPNLKRMAGIDKKISEITSDEIKKIILLNNEKIPMLEELIKDVDTRLIIELKSIETINPIFKIIYEQQEILKRCTFISFYHEALLLLKQKFPEADCAALIAGFPVDPVSMVKNCGCNMISVNYEGISKNYVDKCHDGGIKVTVWTPNDEKSILSSLDAGVDAIASDRPDLVIRLINDHGKSQ